MRECYPVILEKCEDGSGYLVYIPDFDNNTFGTTIAEAVEMARDAINLLGVTCQDDGEPVPPPSDITDVKCEGVQFATLVDVDFDEYRKALDNRAVKKNCTLPSWLNKKAENAHINFSAVLQEALIERLGVN